MRASEAVKDLYDKLRSNGYVAVSIDSLVADSLDTHIYMYVGERSDYLVLQNGNVDFSLLANAGVKNVVMNGKKIPVEQADVIKAKIIRECENSGYPFASVKLDSFQTSENTCTGKNLFAEE